MQIVEYVGIEKYPLSNALKLNTFREALHVVLTDIYDTLKQHYGPFSNFALIGNLDNPVEEPRFTKDGVGIVEMLQYENRTYEYLRQLIMYIGKRIEQRVGDGTTSAMMFVTHVLLEMIREPYMANTDYRTIEEVFKSIVKQYEELSKELSYQVIDPDNNVDLVKRIAFMQAYTSSHGDIDMAKCVEEVFSKMPSDTWAYMTFQREYVETNTPIRLDYDDSQFTTNLDVFRPAMMNKDASTAFEFDSANLVMFPTGISCKAPMARGAFTSLYESACKDNFPDEFAHFKNKKWVFIIPQEDDMAAFLDVDAIHNNAPGSLERVVLFTSYQQNPEINDFRSLCYAAGQDVKHLLNTQGYCIIPDVHIHGIGREMKFDNLYPNPNNSVINPFAEKPGVVKDYLNYLQAIIKEMKTSVVGSRRNTDDLNMVQKAFNKIYLARRATVTIGGPAYDNTTYVDIVRDVILATRNSLRDGVVMGGNLSLYYTFEQMYKRYENVETDDVTGHLTKILVNIIRNAIKNIVTVNPEIEFKYSFDVLTKQYNNWDDFTKTEETDKYYIVQPYSTDIEILKRFREVALKLIKTSEFITPNYAQCNVVYGTKAYIDALD